MVVLLSSCQSASETASTTTKAAGAMQVSEDGLAALRDYLGEQRGKVVYIDCWATWCKPCLKEFAHSAALHQQAVEQFGEAKVAFLYLCLDNNAARWEEMRGNYDLPGTHMLLTKKAQDEVSRAYSILSMPKYMIVGPDGAILQADAPRPSEQQAALAAMGQAMAQ